MTAELWARLKPLFEAAIEKPVTERDAFVAGACAADLELQRELRALLEAHARQGAMTDWLENDANHLLSFSHRRFAPAEVVLGRFRIARPLGSGGMGDVYEAFDAELGQTVALKAIRPGIADSEDALSRFKKEVQLARRLSGPNICRIHELFVIPGSGGRPAGAFLTMEFLKGETLADRLRRTGPIAGREAKPILFDICAGLAVMHEAGIVHRDLKNRNIMLADVGGAQRTILMDFGLARSVSPAVDGGDTRPTLPGAILGTPEYMAPEQFEGKEVSPATDIYALGVVLYEMLTGRHPFSASSALGTAILRARPPVPASSLQPGLPRLWDRIIAKCLEYHPQRRYQSASGLVADLRAGVFSRHTLLAGKARILGVASGAVVLLLNLLWVPAIRERLRGTHSSGMLTDQHAVVVADFDNKTGDGIFDDTLKQGLSAQLEQSPFLNLLSEQKIADALKLMGRSAGDRLTAEVAREVCQRVGGQVTLAGSIAPLGRHYVIGLKAINCNVGDLLAETQEEATNKEGVLKALDAAAAKLRGKLGESISSVQKYDTPLEAATTPSLEALKAYSLGQKIRPARGDTAALPFYNRAVELDSNFARAYVALSFSYLTLGELDRASENARKAYDLRNRVSERERYPIMANYYLTVTGELNKAVQIYELWQQNYPKDYLPHSGLGYILSVLGKFQEASQHDREAMRLEPGDWTSYSGLANDYTNLNQLDEAEKVLKQADERKLEDQFLFMNRYVLAFLRDDAEKMTELSLAAQGNPGTEDVAFATQADTEGWYGRFQSAREFTRRAIESAQGGDASETAASYQAVAALREAEAGNPEEAIAYARAAVRQARNRLVLALAALALARGRDAVEAEKLAAELDKDFPLDTVVQKYWLPTIRAAVAIDHKNPRQAVEILQAAKDLEFNAPSIPTVALCPVYLRGDAYLMLRDGHAAAAEFQKFIDHRGLVANFPWGATARLGLARAYAVDRAESPAARDKARAAYEAFIRLWKDADPGTPTLVNARDEYAGLR